MALSLGKRCSQFGRECTKPISQTKTLFKYLKFFSDAKKFLLKKTGSPIKVELSTKVLMCLLGDYKSEKYSSKGGTVILKMGPSFFNWDRHF